MGFDSLPIYEKYKSGVADEDSSSGEGTCVCKDGSNNASSGESRTLVGSSESGSKSSDGKWQFLRTMVGKGNKVIGQVKAALNSHLSTVYNDGFPELRRQHSVRGVDNVAVPELLVSRALRELEERTAYMSASSSSNSDSLSSGDENHPFGIPNFATLFENSGSNKCVRFKGDEGIQKHCYEYSSPVSSEPSQSSSTPAKTILKCRQNFNQDLEMRRMYESDGIAVNDFVRNLQRKQVLRSRMNKYFSDVRAHQIELYKDNRTL
ncbi:hypothetical protein TRICI_000188 [Trichomonascus ciferrii]|uniref:Uncharacterized protein n=1 Tax=Trichomonascus ciferrii TaxID=44093 RepID=A0A642VE35_9ASCO|nr:hypothetical protein TRICI_000188 [Trichomonascus ciferrii]